MPDEKYDYCKWNLAVGPISTEDYYITPKILNKYDLNVGVEFNLPI